MDELKHTKRLDSMHENMDDIDAVKPPQDQTKTTEHDVSSDVDDSEVMLEAAQTTNTETPSTQPEQKLLSKEEKSSEHVESELPTSSRRSESLLETVSEPEFDTSHRISFEEFTDERTLVSHDAFGNKQMKIKVLEVSDEIPPIKWKFGDRIKVTKILVTIKHLSTQEVEEAEFDIEAIERELAEKRHYTSTNRWVPVNEIKNGYVVGSRHTSLISDAAALDYIVF